MQPPLINPLFGTQPAAATSKAQPASGAAFGEMLARELGSRQAAHAETPPRASQTPQSSSAADRARTAARPSQSTPSPGADTAGLASARARQESQRAQDRRDSNTQADAADKVNTEPAANAGSGDRTTGPGNASAGKDIDKQTDKAGSKVVGNDDTDVARAAGEAASEAPTGAAAAALLALVNSMAPRAGTMPDAAATATDPVLTAQKGAALLPGSGHDVAGDSAEKSDPAFDALLAQAAQATEARDAARGTGAGTERNLPGVLPQAAAAAAGSATALPADLAARAEFALVQPSLAQVAFERDAANAVDAAAPPPATMVGTAATAGVLPAGQPGASESLAPRVGTPAWDNALGHKVVWMAAGAEQSASLTLNPPDLGPLQVVINVSNSHAEATFTAAQPEVRQALEAAMPKLKEMLADAGISLGQTSVGAGSADQGSAQAQQQAQRQARRTRGGDTADGTLVQPARSNRIVTGGNGLVDTFA